MGLQGSFRDFSPSDIIQLLYVQKKTGKLTVQSGDRGWVLGFVDGMLVTAFTGTHGMPRLGEILIRQGYLNREILANALKEQADRPRHLGKVLEDQGHISHADIARALSFQIQETALNLFFHTDGDYLFERVPVSYDTEYITPINTEFVLMEGARRVDEWPSVLAGVVGGDSIFAHESTAEQARIDALNASERRVFDVVDGKLNVDQVVQTVSMGLFDTCRILAALLDLGLIRRQITGAGPLLDPIVGDTVTGPSVGHQGGAAAFAGVAAPARISAGDRLDRRRTMIWATLGTGLAAASLWAWAMLGHLPLP